MNIIQAIDDPQVFAPWFQRGEWGAWLAFLHALFALPMAEPVRAIYTRQTGRTAPPSAPFAEAALVIGRRGGKSFIMALVAVYLAAFRDYRPYLQPGERATILVIAADRKQARAIMRYVVGLLEGVPMLRAQITGQAAESIDLARFVTIEVGTASIRSVRGYTVAACLCDELAFWPTDEHAANPDSEITNAVRPAMATIPNALMLLASSPYAKRGELYRVYREHYGRENAPVLVWQADTRTMNPTVPESVVAAAYARDSASATAEFGGQFRTDVEAFLSRETVEAAIRFEPLELPFDRANTYRAFVDPAGGGQDEYTIAIGHAEGARAVVDVVRAARGVPAEITAEFAALLKSYGLKKVSGDKYAGSWPGDEFRRHGIEYTPSEKPKGGLYLDLLPALNSGRVELPPDDRLIVQLSGLERRTARGGRDSIDHPPNGHDDRANAVAGVVGLLSPGKASTYTLAHVCDPSHFLRSTSNPLRAYL